MRFSSDDVQRFAAWSADRNPLHVDEDFARQTHFGRTIVHGVLTALEALRSGAVSSAWLSAAGRNVKALDIEFRSAAVVGDEYNAECHNDDGDFVVTLKGAHQIVLAVRAEIGQLDPAADRNPAWVALGPTQAAVRTTPAVLNSGDLEAGVEITGAYPMAPAPDPMVSDKGLSPTHARVLALCSYVTGMELPGLRSLFTRITVRVHAAADEERELWYRARTTRFDKHFRLLDTELQVVAPSGIVVASALLRSYVPFSPAEPDVNALAAVVHARGLAMQGKVALVLGGSRGLGAEIAASLALAGCRVYASARQLDALQQPWLRESETRGGTLELLQGDAGDPAWCESTLDTIRERHGRLDVLVLNACAPPGVLKLGSENAARYTKYVRDNLTLVETPLATFASALDSSNGALVYISSSFVEDAPAGFGHYVAVKQAAEGLVRTLCHERPGIAALIARPPVLQTRWNDTPAGIAGAIPPQRVALQIVSTVASETKGSSVALLSEFPPVETAAISGNAPQAAPEFSIRLASTFTVDPFVPAMRFWAGELNSAVGIEAAPYGQLLQLLLDPTSLLNAHRRGVNVIFLRIRDWLRELADEQAGDIDFVRDRLQQTVRDFERALRTHRTQASCETLLFVCPSYGALSSAERILVRHAEADVVAAASALPGVQAVFANQYHAAYSVNEDDVHDELRDSIAHIPYRDEYLCVLATVAARQVYRRLMPARKVVVVDCDNTLWRGVVGEVGPEGVEFDEGHHALHKTLERLTATGVLVCLCSKNEEADVWRVFDTRADLLLRREDIVAAAINWSEKPQNLRTLAARLNLGLDSFVFIDDNPVECAAVQAGCPEVLTLLWPQDHLRARRLVEHVWEFDAGTATREDARRTNLYREEFQRQQARAETLTFDDFIKNLELVVDIAPLAPEDLRRAAQLTLRTNQFNFTTIRRDETDIQTLLSSGCYDIRTVRVRDRFGDYGLVGLVIAECHPDVWILDTCLLSCRVLGRGVEHRILADLGQRAAAAGAARVKLRVEITKRNTPARSFLDSVVPSDFKRADANTLQYDVPSGMVGAIRFEPATAADVESQGETDTRAPIQPADSRQIRRREVQIFRSAYELATGVELRAAIDGRPLEATIDVPATADIAAIVHAAFARALRILPERIAAIDDLEALGCGSLQIVETTVALTEKFPWIPSTLLFEHRSVSAIISEIAKRSSPGKRQVEDAPTPSSVSAGQSVPHASLSSGIAVVGMHVRCAGANSPAELWDLLSSGRSAVNQVPSDRRHFLQPLSDSRRHWAGLLDNPSQFDAAFFGVSPREAEFMDPQLRLFLEVAWGALEDAGCAADPDPSTGVFAGVMYGDYGSRANVGSTGTPNPYRCWEGFSLANRLSQLLGFHGPSLAVDTACSSSATALHLACAALRAGECNIAVVGGVNLILDPDRFASLGRLGILSNRGRCEPFGADADGTVLGEGAGVVVLRPLDEALRRGDRVYGVIRGTGLSTGSGTVGFTAPNPQAQSQAIHRALKSAQVDPRTITYIETHGTGTVLGDPIEVRGLTLGYGTTELQDQAAVITHRATIGSIKPNIGHLEAGAGVLGLIKVLLQLSRQKLLPSITSALPNPQIPFAQGPFDIQRELTDWPRPVMQLNGTAVSVPRRAGLSSFGVGGANAHVIVEEASELVLADQPIDRPLHLLALSAAGDAALQQQAGILREYLEREQSVSAGDFCYSVNTSRKHLDHRLTLAAAERGELLESLGAVANGVSRRGVVRGVATSGTPPKTAFLFTGQGSQYAGMGRQLYDSQPVFRAAIDRCAATLDTLLNRPLLELLFAADGTVEADLLNQTGYTQPALFALEYALSELWQSWGIRPDVVLGHSVGEIGAMCVAGGVTLDEGLRLISARGRLMQALPAGGVMTSVMADERRVFEAIAGCEDLVSIAAINAPGQIVISGAGTAVAEITARLTADGVKTKSLAVSHAFHSPLMKPMLAEYERVVRGIRFSRPRVPFVNCVDGVLAGDEITHTEYWLRNVIEPVRFADGARTLESQGVTAYLEIGPHPVLLGMTRQTVSDDAVAWLPSLRKDADAWQTILASVADFYVRGGAVDWKGFDRPYARARVSVPGYRFSRREYWIKNTPALVRGAAAETTPAHDHSIDTPGPASYQLVWRQSPVNPLAPHGSQAGTHWIIVADAGGVASELGTRIAAHGGLTTTLSADEWDAAPLWNGATSGKQRTAWRVVDLRALDCAQSIDSELERVVWNAVKLTQSVAGLSVPDAKLWIVTRDASGQDPARPVALAAAPLWGLGRTIALEYPEVWGGLIDVSFETPVAAAAAIAAEVLAPDGEDQVSLDGRGRHVPRLVRSSETPTSSISLSAEGTYLVTGGTGALGLHAAHWLVARGARRVVLASRSGVVAEGSRPAVAALEKLGASIAVVAADVSRAADVDRLVREIAATSTLKGVIHAAGVDNTVALGAMSPGDVSAALAGKAIGAWLLHERTRTLNLELFVCFSSMSSILGAQNRGHYAAANAFLDMLAAERRRQGLSATTVNWGPWTGGGMASPDDLRQFAQIGNRGLNPDDAVEFLESILMRNATQTMVADVDWDRFRQIYEARRARPILTEVTQDGVNRLEAPPPSAAAPWVARLRTIPPGERAPQLAGLLRAEVADTLGFDGPESVSPEKSFYDLGMDSLMMADLVGRLKSRVGMPCTALVFNHPNVHSLAEKILEGLSFDADQVTANPTRALDAAPEQPVSHGSSVDLLDPRAEADVLAFQAKAFPDRREDWVAPRWRWMFVESAARLGVKPRFWVHRDGRAIVAQTGSIPVRLKVGNDYLNTGWLVETMVLPDYRSQAVGARLMVDAHEEQPFSLSLGQTQEMRDIQFRLGWTQVAPLQTAQMLVRPENVLKGKVPAPAAWAAGLGLRASSVLRDLVTERGSTSATPIDRFDERHDALWTTASCDLPCAVVRDASYLNWKYVDQPGQEFLRLEVCDESGIKGITVWMFREPDENYRYRRAYLVDLVAPMADPSALRQIITASSAVIQRRGADALLCHHVNGRLTQALRACGFHLRRPERFFLVSPGALSGPALDRVLTADNWLITHGDSDIDRPW